MSVAAGLFFIGVTAAAISDVRVRKVSNRLNLSLLFAGLLWRASMLDATAFAMGLVGVVVGFAMLFVPFAARWVGAGDVKLLAACGAWLGPYGAFLAGLFGLLGGGLLALGIACTAGALVRKDVARNIGASIMTMTSPIAPKRVKALTVPLAVPLAAATIAVFIAQGL